MVALTCVSSLLDSSGVTSTLLTFFGLGLTDDAATPGNILTSAETRNSPSCLTPNAL